jgi:hypothetical protein
MALESTQPLTEMSTRNLPRGKRRPVRKANNLTAICEPGLHRPQPSETKANVHCHIRNPKRLPTANIVLHPKSEPITTQQSFAPELFNAYSYTSFYIYYILIV